VLWALDLEVSYTKMTKAMQYLARGDTFLATNDDLTFPLQTKKAIGMKGSLLSMAKKKKSFSWLQDFRTFSSRKE
jgi:ribonucleotide monophosphatase NagD (HAD superfamily)